MKEKINMNVMFHLCHKIFIGTQDGQQLLDMLIQLDGETPTFPQVPEIMEQHGGALGWAAFRAGQRHFVRAIETMALQHAQQLEAELKEKH